MMRWIAVAVLAGCTAQDAAPVPLQDAPEHVTDAAPDATSTPADIAQPNIADDTPQPPDQARDQTNWSDHRTNEQPDQSADPSTLDALLTSLRADPTAALQAQSNDTGWPAPVDNGYLLVSLDLPFAAGDHDAWAGTEMTQDDGFLWVVLELPPGSRYKFTDKTAFEPDPWSRAYHWDDFGLMSMVPPTAPHLERFFNVGGRTIRVWVPDGAATHLLYMHDGQNLFDPNAPWGGWQLQASVLPKMMLVGIDNTPDRIDEYTHVPDDLGNGPVGGAGDAYADLVQLTIRPLIQAHYTEPQTVGVLGSSLGGLISFHIAQRFPGAFDFAGSMSGTMAWGDPTMADLYTAKGLFGAALYVDSGGNATCQDNYCANVDLFDALISAGWAADKNAWYWWEQDAPHNEAAWAARVWRPFEAFATL